MITRMVGAGARAFLVAVVVATPALLLPGTPVDTAQLFALIALAGGILTFVEYVSASPSLIEFRDAPPFNRIRYLALAATVLLLTLICRGAFLASPLTAALAQFGGVVGGAMDVPFSPVRLILLATPGETPTVQAGLIRALAGLAYVISLASLLGFVAMVKLLDWPLRNGAFNFWINLPLYDPTTGRDILRRLKRDANLNVALGFLLPFLIPAVLQTVSVYASPLALSDPLTLIWTMTAWAFLPASLIMRGVALMRIAELIEEKRRRAYAQSDVQVA